jgi:membrane protease YdiL (CAAX protease family)
MAQQYPWHVAALVVLLCSPPSWLMVGLGARAGLLHHAGLAALGAAMLTALGWWGEAGVNRPARWRNVHLAAIPLAAVAVCFPRGPVAAGAQFLPYALMALLIALQRELWFRGILFRALIPTYGPRRTVLLTALLFALPQAADMLAGAAPGVTLVKALAAGLLGYVLGALRLRTRSIWPGTVVAAVFHLSIFLARFQAAEEMLPESSNHLGLRVFMGLLVYASARLWMRRAEDEVAVPAPEPETVQAS